MLIVGKWLRCEDGVTRPVLDVEVIGANGTLCEECFLVDGGADRTVFSAFLLNELNLPSQTPPAGAGLRGISGDSHFVVVETVILLTRDDGGTARMRGQFAAFTDPTATDMSILGRDVLDNFAVILDRPRDQVLLLNGIHDYVVRKA
jgi:hypothetical protein